VESLLAGVDNVKFAFVTRKNPKDNTKHVILGTYSLNTTAFAA
jgi:translation initiation factor 3 subunit D